MTKKCCAVTSAPFEISSAEANLRDRLGPQIGGRKFSWPEPKLAPIERQRRRLAFRNERNLYRTKSALSGKPIVSSYSPDKPFRVLSREEWVEQDNTAFGRALDFTRPLFNQFAELSLETFKANVIQDGEMTNSEYCHFCGWSKNCYLMFDSGKSEECQYGALFIYCKDCFDCFYAVESELCFDCVKIHNCYELLHSQYCQNCSFSAYLTDCIGCKTVFAVPIFGTKEYYAFNRPVGKAEFERLKQEYFCGSEKGAEELAGKYRAFLDSTPRRALRNVNCVDSSGDLLTNCVDVSESFNVSSSRNCAHCHDCVELEACLDVSMFGEGMQQCYEASGCGGARGKSEVSSCAFSSYIFYGGYNIFYSSCCHQNSKELFACTDLNRKEYCILNKQYTASEYHSLVPRVIEHMEKTGEWGEFFPPGLSPYGYNESIAQEFLPLDKAQALRLGANWSDYQAPAPAAKKMIPAAELGDRFDSTSSFSLDMAIVCAVTGKAFRLTEQEEKYRLGRGLPLPRLHSDERQRRRSLRLSRRVLREHCCSKTGAAIVTTYEPGREKLVFESAYQEACD